MATVRKAAFAGKFYPGKKSELSLEVSRCFSDNALGPRGIFEENEALFAGIVPHAGFAYSGPCAAEFYSRLPSNGKLKTVVILGPNHTGLGKNALSIAPWDYWETPLGRVPVNQALAQKLSETEVFQVESAPHSSEHSIEVQLPFLQERLGKFSILPIAVSGGEPGLFQTAGKALAESIELKKTIVIASSDLNHYESPKETEKKDKLAINAALSGSQEGLAKAVSDGKISMCGVLPSIVLLAFLEACGFSRSELFRHYTSADVIPAENCVGYASIGFFR